MANLRQNLIDAVSLYDIFNFFYAPPIGVNEEGKKALMEYFEKVDMEDRAFVFGTFLTFLRDEGIPYDAEQLQSA